MDRHDELRLIRRAKRGDRDAIAGLVAAHRLPLHRFLLRLTRSPEVAEDIAQDAFVRVLRHLDRFDEQFRFSTWLFTIARRLWINQIQKSRPMFDSELLSTRPGDGEVADLPERQERRTEIAAAVDRGLEALAPRQREVVELFHGRGVPIQEISRRLAIPLGTVKSHLFRGRRRMGEILRADVRFARIAEAIELPDDSRHADSTLPVEGGRS